jgi:AAA-like domain
MRENMGISLTTEGKSNAKRKLKDLYGTQTALVSAAECLDGNRGCSLQTVGAFLLGRPVHKDNFETLCELLKLKPDEVRADFKNSLPTYYVIRNGEEDLYNKIIEPHILLKILAPSGFGKTSLVNRMLERSGEADHLTILINIDDIGIEDLDDHPQNFLNEFLNEFLMQIESKVDYINIGSLDNYCEESDADLTLSRAFRKRLVRIQRKVKKPLTLGITKLDRLLNYPKTAVTFFPLLRAINEESKRPNNALKDFRMVLTYSTPFIGKFINLPIAQSPFDNIGYQKELPELTRAEVVKLSSQYQLSLDSTEIDQLMNLIGGIPRLVKIMLEHIETNGKSIPPLENTSNIYRGYLLGITDWLQKNNLLSRMCQIVRDPNSITDFANRDDCILHGRGLVIFSGNGEIKARCKLYRQYFLQLSDQSK